MYYEIPYFCTQTMASQLRNGLQTISCGQIMLCLKNLSNAPKTLVHMYTEFKWPHTKTPSGTHASLGTTQQSHRITLRVTHFLDFLVEKGGPSPRATMAMTLIVPKVLD